MSRLKMSQNAKNHESHGVIGDSLAVAGPYWLIQGGGDSSGLLTFDLSGFGEVLPIFGGREDALEFSRGMDDYTSQTPPEVIYMGRARLASALRGSLAHIDRVAFDPLPARDLSETVRLASMGRHCFVDLLLGRGKAWSDRADREGREVREGLLQRGSGVTAT